jgi:CRISPR-associated endonuclease Csn1
MGSNLVLGIDLGIASVGWGLLNFSEKRIEAAGVRIFDRAEQPKTGASLALPRRMARLNRRRNRRKKYRLRQSLRLFQKHGLISISQWRENHERHLWDNDPYLLRYEGLERPLTGPEFAQALYHIVKHRGFKSNRKNAGNKGSEDGKLLEGVKQLQSDLADSGMRTVGEMMARHEKFAGKKRNHPGDYRHTPLRDDLEQEIHQLFYKQREFGQNWTGVEFENEFVKWFRFQAPPESGQKILDKVGYCQLEPNAKERKIRRAPLGCYSYELFVLASKLVNLRFATDGHTKNLTTEQIRAIVEGAHQIQVVKYSHVKKWAALGEDDRFSGLDYSTANEKESAKAIKKIEDKDFFKWRLFHDIRKAFVESKAEDAWSRILTQRAELDQIGFVLSIYKTDAEIEYELKKLGLNDAVITQLQQAQADKFGSLSLIAIQKLLPHLMAGFRYDEACGKEGYNHSAMSTDIQKKLPPITDDSMANPVVRRSLSQARKVVNAVIRDYGMPSAIHVESARDLQKSFEERREIKSENEARVKEKDRHFQEFKDAFGKPPAKDELLKFRLYREQNGQCAYSGKPLEYNRLIESNYCEVDHILPYSRSFDDGYLNKVLVTTAMNRQKGNQTPFEFIAKKDPESESWHSFRIRIQASSFIPYKKRQKLLNQEFSNPDREAEFKERNLNDTRYATRFFANHIKKHLRTEVAQPSGQLTAFLRNRWGLKKDREESHLHHAQDALVIAAATRSMIHRASRYSQWKELGKPLTGFVVDESTGELVDKHFPRPWPRFDDEVRARLEIDPEKFASILESFDYPGAFRENLRPIFVSFAPDHKMTGAAHKETIVSKKALLEKSTIDRVNLVELKLSADGTLPLADRENNERLHQALVERLNQFGGDAKKAFKEPFYKPTVDGRQGPLVRKVSVEKKGADRSSIELRQGVAGRGDMVRVDVYLKDKKYWLVPIYVDDVAKGVLPRQAIVTAKPYSNWPIMAEEFFVFSLQTNDYVRLSSVNGLVAEGYFKGCDRSTGSISLSKHFDSTIERPYPKSMNLVEKFMVDPLGRLTLVKGESLRGLRSEKGAKQET